MADRNREAVIAYGIIGDSMRRAIRDGTNEVSASLTKAEALAVLLWAENAGVVVKGYTQKTIEDATNGPAWVPEWARNIVKATRAK